MSAGWLARAAFALVFASAAVLIGFADLASLAMVAVGAVAACLIVAGGYWFLAHRGVVRWMAFGLVIVVLVVVLGAQVALLEGPGQVDVAALARQAVADGADLLGVAGGDGTQALVAGIAAEHGLPFLVISAGTRNHFAMDLGLDRDNPAACLDALTDGVEQRIDLGVIGGRTFVNNASFGAYAEVVESPAYRDDKRGTTLQILPDILTGHRGAKLTAHAGDTVVTGPQALLVSNNPCQGGDIAGLSRRARLDAGTLGVVAVTVNNALQAAAPLRGTRGQGLTTLTAAEVVVDADSPEIPVGIDGETVMMPTPVRCAIQPKALRVRVPTDRPGVR